MIMIKMIDPIMMRKMVVMKVMPIPSVVMCMTLKYSGRWLRSRKSCRPAFESWRSRSRFDSISMSVGKQEQVGERPLRLNFNASGRACGLVGWYCVIFGWGLVVSQVVGSLRQTV